MGTMIDLLSTFGALFFLFFVGVIFVTLLMFVKNTITAKKITGGKLIELVITLFALFVVVLIAFMYVVVIVHQ